MTTTGRSGEGAWGWLSRHTVLPAVSGGFDDGPSAGRDAWARTTAGAVALLLAVQFVTGALLAFYYVPSAEAAHATVAYVERVVPAGSWLRALHFHGSQWLPVALLAHLFQLFLRGAHRRMPVGWLASVLLLALVMSNGATGYSLPWDARAFYSTRIAAGIAGGLPLVGGWARGWLTGGADLTTLTISRFYALHALVVPFAVLAVVCARLFVFRGPAAEGARRVIVEQSGSDAERGSRLAAQVVRQSLMAALVFAALALAAWNFPAPLGPEAGRAEPGYLPRPGAQFLWLFQLLKYFPPALASLVGLLLPGGLLAALSLLPFVGESGAARRPAAARRGFGLSLFALCFLLVAGLSAAAYLEDARDPRVREQLARQTQDEAQFRRAPFSPRLTGAPPTPAVGAADSQTAQAAAESAPPPPPAYTEHCAKCHGARGEGRSVNPPLLGVAARPNRTADDIVAIINNPRAYNLDKRMPAFPTRLTEVEKRAVAEWVVALRED